MKVIDPGRDYELSAGNGLAFLRKEGDLLVRDGTTNEEVLEVLIHRLTEGYQAVPCGETIRALYLLHATLAILQVRTARRVNAQVEGTQQAVERAPVVSDRSRLSPRYRRVDASANAFNTSGALN